MDRRSKWECVGEVSCRIKKRGRSWTSQFGIFGWRAFKLFRHWFLSVLGSVDTIVGIPTMDHGHLLLKSMYPPSKPHHSSSVKNNHQIHVLCVDSERCWPCWGEWLFAYGLKFWNIVLYSPYSPVCSLIQIGNNSNDDSSLPRWKIRQCLSPSWSRKILCILGMLWKVVRRDLWIESMIGLESCQWVSHLYLYSEIDQLTWTVNGAIYSNIVAIVFKKLHLPKINQKSLFMWAVILI